MPMPEIPFFRLLAVPVDDKGDALRAQVEGIAYSILHKETLGERGGSAYSIAHEENAGETFMVDPADFGQIPGSPFAYWVGESIRRLFKTLPSLAESGISAQHGASSKSDFRFLRLAWEVLPETIGKDRRWVNFAKGGQYSPYYADVHLLINWENDAQEIKAYLTERYPYLKGETGWILHPENHYFRPGVTYISRPMRGFCARILPAECVFAHISPAIFVPDCYDVLTILAILNSAVMDFLLSLSLSRGSESSGQTKAFEVGQVQRAPFCAPSQSVADLLHKLALDAHDLQRDRDRSDETTHAFCLPGLLTHRDAPTLREAGLRLEAEEQARQTRLAAIQAEIDTLVFDLYGLSESDRALVLREMGGRESESASQREGETAEPESETGNRKSNILDEDAGEEEAALPPEDLPARVANLLMWCVGVAFGRWDLRKALDPTRLPPLGGPFDPLPRQAPGALDLRLPESASAGEDPKSKLPNPKSDGILPDDPTHPDDLIGRVQAILRVLYGARAEALEAEACALLGFDSLRAYFRDPRKGLFAFHIKRYSKSRRKAPIYWLLQSERRNYGIWLYSHRLEKYALYSAARDYADYKVNFEQGRLDDLKELLARLEGAERRRRERELARQEQLVDEVRTFRQRLDAVAKQDLYIDLNDGVLISIAPLWELVPWKEAARVWEELLAGEYEWSAMGQTLRNKGLVK